MTNVTTPTENSFKIGLIYLHYDKKIDSYFKIFVEGKDTLVRVYKNHEACDEKKFSGCFWQNEKKLAEFNKFLQSHGFNSLEFDKASLIRSMDEYAVWKIDQNVSEQGESETFELVRAMCKKFYKDQFGNVQILVETEGKPQLVNSRSETMKNIISRVLYDASPKKIPASKSQIESILRLLDATADVEGETKFLYNRTAFENGILKYWLGNGEQVNIRPNSWEIVPEEPIWRKYSHQKAQERPIKCDKQYIDLIYLFLNIDKQDRDLHRTSFISRYIPEFPSPIVNIHGSQGSGKTEANKIERRLIDPSHLEVLSWPKDTTELMLMLEQHYFIPFDNVTKIDTAFSDALCRAVSGLAMQKRKLYTDNDVVMCQFYTRLSLNGINTIPKLPDLLERSIFNELNRIEPKDRKSEAVLNKCFELCRPYILGAVFTTLSEALSKYNELNLKELPRMADFALWGEAIAQVLGYEEGKFLNLYNENLKLHTELAIEASVTAYLVSRMLNDLVKNEGKYEWSGTSTDLLRELTRQASLDSVDITKGSGFPKSPDKLGKDIRRLKETFAESGISFSARRDTTDASRRLYFSLIKEKIDIFYKNFQISHKSSKQVSEVSVNIETGYKSQILDLLPNLQLTHSFSVPSVSVSNSQEAKE